MLEKSYDRKEGESAKAWAAFCIYRDMGASRSLDRTTAEFYAGQSPDKHPTANIRRIERWSSQWRWSDRVRDWDTDREMLLRAEQRRKDIEDHNNKLEEYRARNEAIGMESLRFYSSVLAALKLAFAPVERKLQTEAELTKEDLDILFTIPAIAKHAIAWFSSTFDIFSLQAF